MAELEFPCSDSKLDYNFQPKPQFDKDHDELDVQLGFNFDDSKSQPLDSFDSDSESDYDYDSDSDSGSGSGHVGVADFDRPPFCWDYLGFNNTINPTSPEFDQHHDAQDLDDPNLNNDDDATTDTDFFFVAASPSTQLLDTDETQTERDFSILFDTYQERVAREVMIQSHSNNPDLDIDQAFLNLEWQLLLAINTFNAEIDNNNNNTIYDFFLQDFDSRINTPTSDDVINNLPTTTICLDESDVACAICKVDFSSGEQVTQLPCSHYYHRHCIFPWLRLHNTCPLCRFQLPSHPPLPAT